ncbi:protein SCAR1-like [Rutidosis leptorrhynchoides]|uniref:protein SCAR1-like n=1 Tax=Rutidosis leptorrhynchoides TaxID=125765 RepID=UPI003A993369
MPLVRVEVRNEYRLGMPELYTGIDTEDPKAVLDGVAVAGLVGLLRQLGDLAEFAAEVFHGLQEQVLITSSRSHKLVERVHNIEAALPPLEKAILAQRSHLHFAYTAGSHWHTRIRTEQNHFIYSDLPRCIMDSYEDCSDPPRLHKLDKFDVGGPGACFRRYSDPTYFKRTSSGPYEPHLQSLPRQKKARRNKKKRSSSRYKDVTHVAPVITPAGRQMGQTDFGTSIFEDKVSPFEDVSTFDAPRKSEVEQERDRITSFDDTRDGPGYIDCIFRPSYSAQSEDNNSKEQSSSSDSNQLNTSYHDSDENIHNSYIAEQSNTKSPYITWDEKLEIIDSTVLPNETTNISSTTDKVDNDEKEDSNSKLVGHIDLEFNDELRLSTSAVVGGPHDEIESETDFYMDALNTIESESDNDLDFHTKRELQRNSDVINKDVEEGIHKAGHLDDSSANFEFHVPKFRPMSKFPESHMATYNTSNNENYEGVAGRSSISQNTPENFESEEAENVKKADTVASDDLYSRSKESNSQNEHNLITDESPEPSLSTSGGQTTVSNSPVMFWTNGGLLGLEPSKPPDFGLSSSVVPGPIEESKTGNTINNNGHIADGLNFVQEHDGKDDPTNGITDDVINSFRIFEFRNRLLVNGLRKQISLVGDERLASSVKSEVPENTSTRKPYGTVTGIPFREQFGNRTSFVSPSSPPLKHMKISFQPIDGFETSKLKLMFPDGNSNNNESNNGHMFPSFQLVPEPEISLHESASDSDDDNTFCRSSPYASDDDCHSNSNSNPSESNSDQWDSKDAPGIKDHEVDDAFGRISSSAESVSSSLVNGIRLQQPSQCGLLFDIPNFDAMKTSSHNNQVTDDFNEPTPPPPPLPPMEWRGIKPHPNVTLENEDGLSKALNYALNLTPPETTLPRQPKPAPTKQDHFVKMDEPLLKHKRPDWQNLHVQNESIRTNNGKLADEKADFLQQIRTKSRNLRRTSTALTTPTPAAGHTSVKVTAILEKASAIRQAVGSDDGEDNWSDN